MTRVDDESAWRPWAAHWPRLRDTIYLNHGSFGPSPASVVAARERWQRRLVRQPMRFFLRRLEPALNEAKRVLADFVGAPSDDLVFVENSTAAMNVVADSYRLAAGDQVLLTDHEYGAVERIWRRACDRAGGELTIARLPARIESTEQVVEAVLSGVTDRTRMIVVSHVTSATAIIMPVEEICRRAAELGVDVCVDGPHAPAQIDLNVGRLGCRFYTASNHKWLCAPFGSGFLYVAPERQDSIRPPTLSWGRLKPAQVEKWSDEFIWAGTRDPSAYLATADAVRFIAAAPREAFAARAHYLAGYARRRLVELTGRRPITPDEERWYGAMALVPLPPCDLAGVYRELSGRHRIEVMIEEFQGAGYIRVSCHLYNDTDQIDRLVSALAEILR